MKHEALFPIFPPKPPNLASQPPKKRAKTTTPTKPDIKAQNLFLLRCRENAVPGATGPKDWNLVAKEFNGRFKDELNKALSWNTLQKRYGNVKKVERGDVPYNEKFAIADGEGDGNGEEQKQEDQNDEIEMKEVTDENVRKIATKDPRIQNQETGQATADTIAALPTPHPGSYIPSAIPLDQTSLITRAKFHLRHRTNEPITFRFLDPNEANLVCNDPQYIDADTLIAASASSTHRDTIDVPEHVTARTVNIFIQLTSPHPSTQLPTHYLWTSDKAVPGTYDRFGAIQAERITWSVDTLLDLALLARTMNVHWIIDMVIDRLHWMFTTQNRARDFLSSTTYAHAGGRLPKVENPVDTLDVEDFEDDVLQQLEGDAPTMRFVVDVLHELGSEADYAIASREMQVIFANAEASHLETTSREAFCARYHHHAASVCYTTYAVYPSVYYINLLYATSSPQELLALSKGLAPADSLDAMLYTGSGDPDKLKKDNSVPPVLEAEKMVLEMEVRLEEAREALRRVHDAEEAGKQAAMGKAKKAVEAMYADSRVVRV
jgi:hypothetical protein